ncbi:DUF6223 family protein [Plantactinospora sp. KLBMP9567]|uniref:DUF6223 family protein n=1 Tax=Plantactinospora sp. KLBMP9567 TaxID=3085900 RepID=UPI002980F5CA|nr:DUF6223 family protein [Plantactinospora sp. KLBMP9567]MDW5325801.1 DUF6223 family protein [Plantactinospora sp. KLBMP9567]
MSVRHLLATATAALLGGLWLAAPAAAHVAGQPAAATVYTISSGRIGSIVAGLLGLAGVVVGGLARARAAGRIGTGSGRRGAMVALALGIVGVVIGGVVAATSNGNIGTGNGLGGAIVAVALGLVSMALGGLALTRSRRTG